MQINIKADFYVFIFQVFVSTEKTLKQPQLINTHKYQVMDHFTHILQI